MNIENLNSAFKKIHTKLEARKLCLKVCGSYGIFLSNNFLKTNLVGNKLSENLNEIIPDFFFSNYSIPRDIDFVSVIENKSEIEKLFFELGFVKDKRFDTVPGIKRNIFYSAETKVDVFYDGFDFNHYIDLKITTSQLSKGLIKTTDRRIETKGMTIPVTELLLQKLQIVKAGQKDLIDAWWVLHGHDLSHEVKGNSEDLIVIPLISCYTSNQWGFYKTVIDNLAKLKQLITDTNSINESIEKIESIIKSLENYPKSFAWKTRAAIGSNLKWYNEVDEI